MSRFSVAKAKVLDHLESIIDELFPGKYAKSHRRKSLWNVINPYRGGSSAEQMVVWLQGARRGGWKDYVSGDKGDAIDLVAFGLKGSTGADARMVAIEWIEDKFGLKSMAPAQRKAIDAETRTKRAAVEAKEKREHEAAIERARKFFFSCWPIEGSIAEIYLRSRGVELSAVPNLGRALRFHPDCEYWMQAGRPRRPAMIAAMVDQGGRLCACHYTFLKPDGSDKAGLIPDGATKSKDKLMFPSTSGLVIRLTDGPSGLPAEKAAAEKIATMTGIVEGIEDGLSVAFANPDLRMWSAGSLSGFLGVPDHGCTSSYLIFQDNDWGKKQAQAQFRRAVARIKGFGKPARPIAMPADWGKDVNDALRSEW